MKQLCRWLLSIALATSASALHAQPVEYVRVCSLYGAGFNYIPGTDVCRNDMTGDTRVSTAGGVWRSLTPYPQGEWVNNTRQLCTPDAKLVKLATFKAADFAINPWLRMQTAPINLPLNPPQFISKVIMSGGFYDPRLGVSGRSGTATGVGLCLRSIDPTVFEIVNSGGTLFNPPFGNGNLPIGCVNNGRIVGMPAAYAVTATAAYPQIDIFNLNSQGPQAPPIVSGPYLYGKQLVVTTDFSTDHFGGAALLQYFDASTPSPLEGHPLAGSLSVSVCVNSGKRSDDRD
jgi:hypothetical protein